MEANYVMEQAQIICAYLKNYVEINVFLSWGVGRLSATTFTPEGEANKYEMAALSFPVNGFNFKGRIRIAYNEGSDYYDIYGKKRGAEHTVQLATDVCFEDFQSVLDPIIETGCKEAEDFYDKAKNMSPIGAFLEAMAVGN